MWIKKSKKIPEGVWQVWYSQRHLRQTSLCVVRFTVHLYNVKLKMLNAGRRTVQHRELNPELVLQYKTRHNG